MANTSKCNKKMILEQVREDRKINTFFGPYKIECTPYNQEDFSAVTYRKCLVGTETSTWLKICKVIIIGDVSVGKTCMLNRFCRKIFDSNYKSTIGVDFEIEQIDILNFGYNLQIWDTAGQERFKSIAHSYYRGAHVIMVVFDFTNIESLYHSETWLNEALMASSTMDPFIFLVGTKKDLLKKYAYKNMEIHAMKFAKKLNAEYWPVSSRTGKNITNLFYRVACLTFDTTLKTDCNERNVEIGSKLTGLKLKENKRSRNVCANLKCSN